MIALFVALGGTGYAVTVLPKNSVGTAQLKKNAVISSKVKNHSLLAADFKLGQLPAGAAGPPGPAGAAGASGPSGPAGLIDTSKLSVVAGSEVSVPANSFATGTKECPSGGHVISGGYNSGYRFMVEYNAAESTTTWRTGLYNPTGSTQNFHLQIICLAP
jgi:hypothetical protein